MLAQQGSSSSQAALTNPFPQGQQMLASANANTGTPMGGNHEGENPSNVYIMISHVDVATISNDYAELESFKAKVAPDVPKPLHIERPIVEPIPRIPKGSVKRSMINPYAKATQNYSIIEYLAQIPYVMSTLGVLQSFPAQRSVLLTTIRVIDLKNSLIVTFDMSNIKKRLPHHMAFQIKYTYLKMNIF